MNVTNPREIIPKSEFNMNTAAILLLFKESHDIGVVVFMEASFPKTTLLINYLNDKFGEKNCLIGNVACKFSSPQGLEPFMEIGGRAKVGIWYDGDKELKVFDVKHGHWTYGKNDGWGEFDSDWIVSWSLKNGEKKAMLNRQEIREKDILEVYSMTTVPPKTKSTLKEGDIS